MTLRILREQIAAALRRIEHPVSSVLDVWAATQPYRDLLPEHETYVSIDIDEHFGPQDVVSEEFLPFADESFDLIMFTEGFHYVAEPSAGVAELMRVMRPGGTVVITVPLVWEYDKRTVEQRYTSRSLRRLFEAEWEQVEVGENGGYSAAWATVTGRVIRGLHEFGPPTSRRIARFFYPAMCFLLNGIAALLSRAELRWHVGPYTLPAGLTLVARKTSAAS